MSTDRAKDSAICSSLDPSIQGIGNHWRPIGLAAHGSGALGAKKAVLGMWSASASPMPIRSAPSAP